MLAHIVCQSYHKQAIWLGARAARWHGNRLKHGFGLEGKTVPVKKKRALSQGIGEGVRRGGLPSEDVTVHLRSAASDEPGSSPSVQDIDKSNGVRVGDAIRSTEHGAREIRTPLGWTAFGDTRRVLVNNAGVIPSGAFVSRRAKCRARLEPLKGFGLHQPEKPRGPIRN